MPKETCPLEISLREEGMFDQSFSLCFYGEELFYYLLAIIKNVVSKQVKKVIKSFSWLKGGIVRSW